MIPLTQNCAPVIEFRCLYTADIRRKQKRWSDGRLKYHTFNKRVMVYDERSNFVGDTHWREEYNFDEGEEVELERRGILVQVADCIGKKDQDLSELWDKRIKEREDRIAARRARYLPSQSSSSINIQPRNPSIVGSMQLEDSRHGHSGPRYRAPVHLPSMSKLTMQRQDEKPPSNDNIAKRRAESQLKSLSGKSGYAQNLTGVRLTLCARPTRSHANGLSKSPPQSSIQQKEAEIIDLCDTDDNEPAHRITMLKRGVVTSPVGKYRSHGERQTKRRRVRASPLSGEGTSSNEKSNAAPLISVNESIQNTDFSVKLKHNNQTGVIAFSDTCYQPSSTSDENFVDIAKYDAESILMHGKKNPGKEKAVDCSSHPLGPLSSIGAEACTTESSSKTPRARSKATAIAEQHSQSFNPLRIKPRPKKKMMFMARTKLRPNDGCHERLRDIRAESSRSCRRMSCDSASAAEDATSFKDIHLEQENGLQARTEGHRSDLGIETSLSTPWESRIDHHAIDEVLSSKTSLKRLNSIESTVKVSSPDLETCLVNPRCTALLGPLHGHYKGDVIADKRLLSSSYDIEFAEESAAGLTSSNDIALDPTGKNEKRNDSLRGPISNSLPADNMSNSRLQPQSPVKQSTLLLVKTSNRRARTKEVLGFQPTVEDQLIATETVVKLVSSLEADRASPPLRLSKVMNPATRGRKAALISDKAGKAPTTVIPPTISIDQTSTGTSRRAPSRTEDRNPEAVTSAMISSARDLGPWSRESHDLFGWKPKEAPDGLQSQVNSHQEKDIGNYVSLSSNECSVF